MSSRTISPALAQVIESLQAAQEQEYHMRTRRRDEQHSPGFLDRATRLYDGSEWQAKYTRVYEEMRRAEETSRSATYELIFDTAERRLKRQDRPDPNYQAGWQRAEELHGDSESLRELKREVQALTHETRRLLDHPNPTHDQIESWQSRFRGVMQAPVRGRSQVALVDSLEQQAQRLELTQNEEIRVGSLSPAKRQAALGALLPVLNEVSSRATAYQDETMDDLTDQLQKLKDQDPAFYREVLSAVPERLEVFIEAAHDDRDRLNRVVSLPALYEGPAPRHGFTAANLEAFSARRREADFDTGISPEAPRLG